MTPTLRHLSALLTFACLAVACGSPPPTGESGAAGETAGETTGHDGSHDSIPWFEGTVDEAFAVAKAEGKPLFLYWGAIWCPPCHYLKSKIFTQPEFRARIASFVPVYLDGDTERAQILGEKFDTAGYPTVIIFSSEGQEVMRLDGMIPIQSYTDVLENAMNSTQPIEEVVARFLDASISEISRADLNLLAFYSWAQDSRVALEAADRADLFLRLWRETPAGWKIEKARFLALYLGTLHALARDPEAELPTWSDEERQTLIAAVSALLQDPETRNTNLEFAVFWSTETVDLLTPEAGNSRSALRADFLSASKAMESDESLSVDDRLSAIFPQIYLARLPAEAQAGSADEDAVTSELPAELIEHIRDRIAWAGEIVKDENELQAVMSTMGGLLADADLLDEAQSLLAERNQDTVAPYYFMSWLASMKAKAGETEEALGLYRQAWQTASGNYTRFRWGTTYLRNLMELRPDDQETLKADGTAALAELLVHEEAFAGGNWGRLQSLETGLESWNEDGRGDEILDGFRAQVRAVCDRYPAGEGQDDDDSAAARCRSFLSEDDLQPQAGQA